MTLIVLGTIAAVTLGIAAMAYLRARDARPVELHGDWWPAFEAAFRDYAEQLARKGGYDSQAAPARPYPRPVERKHGDA